MADITITPAGAAFNPTDTVTSTRLNEARNPTAALDAGTIVNADVSATADISGSKLADATVTKAKIENISAPLKVLGRTTAGAGVAEEVTINNEDDMANASAITLATDESIKAYVDTEVAGVVTTYKSSFVACPARSANTVFAHSLGAVPDIVNVQLKCISASIGFATGEIVMLSNSFSYSAFGSGVEIDATNVTFHIGANGLILIAPDGTYQTLDGNQANFEIKVIAVIL